MQVGRRGVLIGSAAVLLAGCSTDDQLKLLNVANALTPGDEGVRKLVTGLAFGADPRQKLDVYAPKAMIGLAPVVLFVYGGNWTFGGRQGYAFVGEALASRGFVTVIADYRLVPQVLFPGFVQDAALAVRWIVDNIARYGSDAGRLGLCGHSAGGYNVAMVAFDPQWLRQAGVDPAAVRALATLSAPLDFYPFDSPVSQRAFGEYPAPKATQPISFARRDAPPAFLTTGTKDTTVMPKNSINMAAALQRVGATAELKLYPGLDHTDMVIALSKPFRGKAPVLEDVTGFLHAELV